MRLIDADKIHPDVRTQRGALAISQGQLAYAPTVEAIPKTDYEARLKADMVAMLTEIQMEIEEVPKYCITHDTTCVYRKAEEYISDINKVIQQKIDALKGEEGNE